MRWFWIDRYLEFTAGVEATAVKAVTLAEEHLHDHFPGFPVMPNSLILEGVAQTGGLLVAQQHDFTRNVVLAKVSKAQFHLPALPGDTLRYRAVVESLKLEGASVALTSHIGDSLQAEASVFFAYVDDIGAGQQLFPEELFTSWLRMLRLFEVGKHPDGRPLELSVMQGAQIDAVASRKTATADAAHHANSQNAPEQAFAGKPVAAQNGVPVSRLQAGDSR
jgi:3-hydroxyacyl-[acyl-carrier-protein] dehydratase